MSEVACRDTTFDGVLPKRVWLCYNNRKQAGKGLVISIEINGIEKELNNFVYPNDGFHLGSHNLTWILNPYREFMEDFVAKCEGIQLEPGSFTRLDLSEFYDRAKQFIAFDQKD